MGQYIDKSALIAEIKRKIKNINLNYICSGSHPSDFDVNKKLQDGILKNLQALLSFLDTLGVKEVDLEKEIDTWYQKKASKEFENVLYKDIEKCAKHFYELGLKASQEGE